MHIGVQLQLDEDVVGSLFCDDEGYLLRVESPVGRVLWREVKFYFYYAG